jgi:cell shape-determining protein MreC
MCTEDYMSRVMLLNTLLKNMDALNHTLEHQVDDLSSKLSETSKLLEESRTEGEATYQNLKETIAKKI